MKSRKRVLVCEDDPVQLAILSAALGQAGFETATARSSEEGLRRAAQADAVIADIHLAQGTAFDLLAGLRSGGRDTPTLMISGRVTPFLRERAIRAGVRGLLEKPCDIPSIVRVVRGLFEGVPRTETSRPILLPRLEIVGRADGPPRAESAPPPLRRVGILAAPPAGTEGRRGSRAFWWAAGAAALLAGAVAWLL